MNSCIQAEPLGNSRYTAQKNAMSRTCYKLLKVIVVTRSLRPFGIALNGTVRVLIHQIDKGKFEIVSRPGLCSADRTGGELDDGVRGQTGRKPPGRHCAPNLLHSPLSIQVDKVNREPHAKGVHRLAGDDPQTFPSRKTITSEQPFPARCTMIRHLDRGSENRAPC